MTPKRSKRTGGPRTEIGKTVSSKNSIKHGLTALGFTDGYEAEEGKAYIDELIAYYKPQSPLEKLQIQRIAMCRAKLAKLYAVEQATQDLALLDLEVNPADIWRRMEGVSVASQRMAMSMVRDEKSVLPLGLNEKKLKEINLEIESLKSLLSNELTMRRFLKHTVRFLETLWSESDEGEFSADRYLSWGVKKIQDFSVAQSSKETEKGSYEEMLANVQLPDEVRGLPKVSVRDHSDADSFHDSVCLDLRHFSQLWQDFVAAQKLTEQFNKTKGLMVKAVTPSAEESDRLMRYQTSIERRLSSAIGELLALQARR
jgi:hypothetical protein